MPILLHALFHLIHPAALQGGVSTLTFFTHEETGSEKWNNLTESPRQNTDRVH